MHGGSLRWLHDPKLNASTSIRQPANANSPITTPSHNRSCFTGRKSASGVGLVRCSVSTTGGPGRAFGCWSVGTRGVERAPRPSLGDLAISDDSTGDRSRLKRLEETVMVALD